VTQQVNPISVENFTFTLNGATSRVKDISPTTTLLHYLRQNGYVGTKEGCGDGDCGACTVTIIGKDSHGQPQYQAVNSCLVPIGAIAGREVITAEGIANGQLHPVQAAMVETAGSQCGYCTPGFIMSMFAAYYNGSLSNDICIEGNLCRCTGYVPIRKAAQQLAATIPDDHFSNELAQKTSDLAAIAYTNAAVPLSHIEDLLHGIFPSLDEMLHWFAARQIRNRATLGGNIGTASPIGDLPPVLLALDATLKLVSTEGDRSLPLADFFKGYRQTELKQGEIIHSVTIPKAIASGATKRLSQSYKIGKRGTDDISIVAAAFVIDLDADQKILHARLAYGGVAATPIRAIAVELMLVGQPWTMETVRSVKPALREVFTPLSDLRGSADYRKMLVGNLFEKFFVEHS